MSHADTTTTLILGFEQLHLYELLCVFVATCP